jgi:hypothetical protein
MKPHAVLATSLSFVFASLSLYAMAADQPAPAKESGAQENAPRKTMKKHSHLEEKGLPVPGRASTGKAAMADGQSAGTGRNRHIHPRDAK